MIITKYDSNCTQQKCKYIYVYTNINEFYIAKTQLGILKNSKIKIVYEK